MKKEKRKKNIGIVMIIVGILIFGVYIYFTSFESTIRIKDWSYQGDKISWSSIKQFREEIKPFINLVYVDSNSPIKQTNNENYIILYGAFDDSSYVVSDTDFNISINSIYLYRYVEIYENNGYWQNIDYSTLPQNLLLLENKSFYINDNLLKFGSYNFKNYYESTESSYIFGSHFIPGYPGDTIYNCDNDCLNLNIDTINLTEYMTLQNQNIHLPNGFSISGNYITNSKDIDNPQTGDIRLSYEYAKDINNPFYEIYGLQKGNKIITWVDNIHFYSTLEEAKNKTETTINQFNKSKIKSYYIFVSVIFYLFIFVVPIIGWILILFGGKMVTNIFDNIKKKWLVLLSFSLGFLLSCIILFINDI